MNNKNKRRIFAAVVFIALAIISAPHTNLSLDIFCRIIGFMGLGFILSSYVDNN